MAIHYHCRHCGVKIGSIDNVSIHSEQLGLHKLSDEERQDMVSYNQQGEINIISICEDCHEYLQRNPDHHQYDFLIH